MAARARPDDVREACLVEAFRIIEEAGIEKLSLRDVARRVGVSHQAPYKHFPSRDHILAEIVARCFDEFAVFLGTRPPSDQPHEDLQAMGLLYLEYAQRHPLKYRLMFSTPLPDPRRHPRMMQNAHHAFSILRDRLQGMPLRQTEPQSTRSADLDAMFIWSTLHGLSSILHSDMLAALKMSELDQRRSVQRCFARLSLALSGNDGTPAIPKRPLRKSEAKSSSSTRRR